MTKLIEEFVNKIIQGNCLEVMRGMPNDSVDLTITSPPYDSLREYKGYEFNFEEIAKQLFRVTKYGGVVVWVVGDATINGSETGTSFRQALYFKEIGFNLHDTMIYLKENLAFPDKNRYYQGFEYMFIFSKGAPKTFNAIKDKINKSFGRDMKGSSQRLSNGKTVPFKNQNRLIPKYSTRYNYWFLYNAKRGMENKHPATFPEKLAKDHIISWSNEGDTILDCMCGSGTTCKMAKLNNRKYIGIEISKEYCGIAEKRIESIDKTLF